jgi:hypothetical protein
MLDENVYADPFDFNPLGFFPEPKGKGRWALWLRVGGRYLCLFRFNKDLEPFIHFGHSIHIEGRRRERKLHPR